MPVYATITLIIFLASMGLPLLNGFIGEVMILLGAYAANKVWAYWAVSGIVLGAAYLLWLYQRVFWGPITNEENSNLPDLNARELATLVPLVVLCFWIGVYPKPFLAFLHRPMAQLAAHDPAREVPGRGRRGPRGAARVRSRSGARRSWCGRRRGPRSRRWRRRSAARRVIVTGRRPPRAELDFRAGAHREDRHADRRPFPRRARPAASLLARGSAPSAPSPGAACQSGALSASSTSGSASGRS